VVQIKTSGAHKEGCGTMLLILQQGNDILSRIDFEGFSPDRFKWNASMYARYCLIALEKKRQHSMSLDMERVTSEAVHVEYAGEISTGEEGCRRTTTEESQRRRFSTLFSRAGGIRL